MDKTASIEDYELPHGTHNFYVVTFNNRKYNNSNKPKIHTTVTNTSSVVDNWISALQGRHHLVGLAVERCPNTNTVATVQLCVNRVCLIFQINHARDLPQFTAARDLPQSLKKFLWNKNHTFVGVGIAEYGLKIANEVDLGALTAEKLWAPELRNAGLEDLAGEVIGEFIKEEKITMSKWNNERLSREQVQYACTDAFLSSEIGKSLNA